MLSQYDEPLEVTDGAELSQNHRDPEIAEENNTEFDLYIRAASERLRDRQNKDKIEEISEDDEMDSQNSQGSFSLAQIIDSTWFLFQKVLEHSAPDFFHELLFLNISFYEIHVMYQMLSKFHFSEADKIEIKYPSPVRSPPSKKPRTEKLGPLKVSPKTPRQSKISSFFSPTKNH